MWTNKVRNEHLSSRDVCKYIEDVWEELRTDIVQVEPGKFEAGNP